MKMDVWLEFLDAPIGTLTRSDDMNLSFSYADPTNARTRLSLSLMVRAEPYADAACRGYFANLLFEGPEMERILDSYELDRGDVGSLLWHLGADCPGSVSITPGGSGPGKAPGRFPQDYQLLRQDVLQEIILSLHLHKSLPEDRRDPSPLAGVQGKIAVVEHAGHFYLPRAGSKAPTSHILKVSPYDDAQITRDEVALLKIAQACGIEAADSVALEFDISGHRINAILSTRFDRSIHAAEGGYLVSRVHVEDFCQALGLPPGLKYERNSLNPSHRFSAAAVAKISAQASSPAVFQRDFLQHVLFNLIVGNTDNHGKNGSIIHNDGHARLAPLYDVVPVFTDNEVTHQMAFRHGSAEFAEDFTIDCLAELMIDLGFVKPHVSRALRQVGHLASSVAVVGPQYTTKELADALHAQALVVSDALGVDFHLPVREFSYRAVRDERQKRPVVAFS